MNYMYNVAFYNFFSAFCFLIKTLIFNTFMTPFFFKTDEIKHYVSSSRGNSKVQSLKVVQDIVNDLVKHEDSWPFLKPVNKKLVSGSLTLNFLSMPNIWSDYKFFTAMCQDFLSEVMTTWFT